MKYKDGSEITVGDIVDYVGMTGEVIFIIKDGFIRDDLKHVNPYLESDPFGVFIQLEKYITQVMDTTLFIKPITKNKNASSHAINKHKTLQETAFTSDIAYYYHIGYQILEHDPEAIESAVNFVCGISRGISHNRTRSLLARRLKHVELSKAQIDALTVSIFNKFETGDIDRQFLDQLRLCYSISPDATKAKATERLNSPKDYIQSYAKKVLAFNKPLKRKKSAK